MLRVNQKRALKDPRSIFMRPPKIVKAFHKLEKRGVAGDVAITFSTV